MKQYIQCLAILVLIFTLTSCDSDINTNPTPSTNGVLPPSDIEVSTRNETTIAFRWKRTKGDTSIHTGYEITAKPGSGSPFTRSINVSDSSEFLFTGLNEGTIYEFRIRTISGMSQSSNSVDIQWSPARRTTKNARIYSSSSTFGSGIELSSGSTFTIEDADKWDLCFDDKNGQLLIGSPKKSSYVNNSFLFPNGKSPKLVRIRNLTTQAATLDDIWETISLGNGNQIGDASYQFQEQMIKLNDYQPMKGGIGFVVTVVNTSSTGNPINFAKVLVKSTGNSFVQSTGDNRYLELEVSYQPNINVPFAF